MHIDDSMGKGTEKHNNLCLVNATFTEIEIMTTISIVGTEISLKRENKEFII